MIRTLIIALLSAAVALIFLGIYALVKTYVPELMELTGIIMGVIGTLLLMITVFKLFDEM